MERKAPQDAQQFGLSYFKYYSTTVKKNDGNTETMKICANFNTYNKEIIIWTDYSSIKKAVKI